MGFRVLGLRVERKGNGELSNLKKELQNPEPETLQPKTIKALGPTAVTLVGLKL